MLVSIDLSEISTLQITKYIEYLAAKPHDDGQYICFANPWRQREQSGDINYTVRGRDYARVIQDVESLCAHPSVYFW